MSNILLSHQIKAFSLVELLTVIGIIAIILAIAVPDIRSIVFKGKQEAELKNMVTTLAFARNSALERKHSVVVCSGLVISSDNRIINPCVNNNIWDKNLTTYYEIPANVVPTNTPPKYTQILNTHNLTDQFYWVWSGASNRKYLRFTSNGLTDNQNGTFYLCSNKKAKGRLVINKAGRVNSEKPRNSDHDRCSI